MAINRVIYTQGAVRIQPMSGAGGVPSWFHDNLSSQASGFYLVGVQSANFTVNSPKEDVGSFGVLGTINKVQVAPQTASLEVSLIINSGNVTTDPHWLSGLTYDTQQPLPSGIVVTASGIGCVSGAILTSLRCETAVGALPTLQLTFEGVSGATQSATAPTNIPNTTTVSVTTPDAFGSLYWTNQSGPTGCPQSVRASWEMPVERINCLGNAINSPTIFSRPPGTMSFTAEGCDPAFVTGNNYLTGVKIGPYLISQNVASIKEVSRSANMQIGEAASTFNINGEGVALGAVIDG